MNEALRQARSRGNRFLPAFFPPPPFPALVPAAATAGNPLATAAPKRSLGEAKIEFCRRLGAPSWLELADHLGIRSDERDTWAKGHEARASWGWLENRRILPDLAAACRKIKRPDLADLLEGLDFPR